MCALGAVSTHIIHHQIILYGSFIYYFGIGLYILHKEILMLILVYNYIYLKYIFKRKNFKHERFFRNVSVDVIYGHLLCCAAVFQGKIGS